MILLATKISVIALIYRCAFSQVVEGIFISAKPTVFATLKTSPLQTKKGALWLEKRRNPQS